MPVPHLNIRIVQRSKGSSAVAGAAYQAGEKLFSEYDQKSKDHRRKQPEVVYTEILLPANAPPEYADRATLWNLSLIHILKVKCAAACSQIQTRNSVQIRARFRPMGGAWSGYTELLGGLEQLLGGGLSPTTSYDVELSARDTVGHIRTVRYTASTSQVTLHLHSGGKGAAFGKYSETAGLECAWQMCIRDSTISPIHNEAYFVRLAKELEEMGADAICIKDMANLLLPMEAYSLVKALK